MEFLEAKKKHEDLVRLIEKYSHEYYVLARRKPHRYISPHWTPQSLTTPTISLSILFRRCSVSDIGNCLAKRCFSL